MKSNSPVLAIGRDDPLDRSGFGLIGISGRRILMVAAWIGLSGTPAWADLYSFEALGRMHPDAGPARWNAMFLHLRSMGDRVPSTDNLVPNLRAIRITRSVLEETGMVIAWRGGTGPYQVQWSPSLATGTWENLGLPTDGTTTTVPAGNERGFFRITRP